MDNNEIKTNEVEAVVNEQQPEEPKKKNWKKIIGIAVAIIVVLAAFGCWFSGLVGGISESEAKNIAYGQVPEAKAADSALVNKEFDDGKMVYNVQLSTDGAVYDMTILKRNGDIVSSEMMKLPAAAQTTESAVPNDIGVEKAKEIALAKVPGATASDVKAAELEAVNGVMIYEIEVRYDKKTHDFEINAQTGEIMNQTCESVFN